MTLIEKKITKLYDQATKEAAKIGVSLPHFNPDKPFDAKNYPSSSKKLNKIIEELMKNIRVTIENGIDEQWEIANSKNDEMCHLAFGPQAAAMTGEQLSKYFNNHDDARNAFKQRKMSGMGLSDRVWNLTEQFKEQVEMAIDLGLRDGVSAARMSTTLKQYLNDPDKLFRRVRDEHGVLRLSKAAKSYHPGQGRYRSSHKNAMRLARTETNMAYRTADHLRIQDFDFVVGIEVHRSNRPYPCPVCEALAGKYPKDFKFVGWHPQCRCYTTTILKDDEEFWDDIENDTNTPSKNEVKEPPKGFNDWVKDSKERIERAEKKNNLAYFLRDNKGYVDSALGRTNAKSGKTIFKTNAQKKAIQERWDARKAANIKEAQSTYDDTWELLQDEKFDNKIKYLAEANDAEINPLVKSLYADKIDSLNSIKQAQIKRHATRDVVDIQKRWDERRGMSDVQLLAEKRHANRDKAKIQRNWDENRAISLLRTKFTDLCENIPTGGKMTFGNTSNYNGHTYMRGDIHLSKGRYDDAITAITKIRTGKTIDITHKEGDALTTLWHEITHNRNKVGLVHLSDLKARYMELANELTTRKTLPDFYKRLGANFDDLSDDVKGFMHNRATTGYNDMVTNYDYVLDVLKLDKPKAYETIQTHLFNEHYALQVDGLKQGLIDAGIKYKDGKALKPSDLSTLVKEIEEVGERSGRGYRRKNGKAYYTDKPKDLAILDILEKLNLLE